MFGKIKCSLLVLSIFTSQIGCAQPKYEVKSENKIENSTQESKATCDLHFIKSGLCLSIIWEKMPTDTEAGSFVFKSFKLNSYDSSQVLVDLAFLPKVLLWMPGMGHGSSPTVVQKLDTGTYLASKVYFVMPGDWEIKIQLLNGKTLEDEAVLTISI